MCDVGFGKTEVALRAAFIVAMSGAQTAIIAPTTYLRDNMPKLLEKDLRAYRLKFVKCHACWTERNHDSQTRIERR